MRAIIVIFLMASFAGQAIALDGAELAVGQVWRIENPPSPETRIVIGKIDEIDGGTIVHVMVRGLPDLPRDPGKIKLLSKGGISSESAGGGPDKFVCHYLLTPSADNKSVSIKVQFMPVEYPALANSLTTLEASGEIIDANFERSWEKWDSLREPFDGDYREFPTANKPLSEILAVVRRSANSTLNIMERIGADIFGADRERELEIQE